MNYKIIFIIILKKIIIMKNQREMIMKIKMKKFLNSKEMKMKINSESKNIWIKN